MAFLVSFDDSDSDSAPYNTPTAACAPNTFDSTSLPKTPSTSLPTRSRPLPLQLAQPHSTPTSSAVDLPATKQPPTGMATPPSTPLVEPMRNVSISSSNVSRRSIDSMMSNASSSSPVEPKQFDFTSSDYTVSTTNLLGEGLWSNVYLAHPSPTGPQNSRHVFTPPLTPVKSRSRANTNDNPLPTSYAIKTPTSRSARNVLTTEARILSYVTTSPDVASYVVPFYGQDSRNGALVLAAMPETLERFIVSKLNCISEADRSERLAAMFPSFVLRLVKGMEALHSVGVVHADLKPSNILLQLNSNALPKPYYADFSSSISPPHLQVGSEKTSTPLGGGTWDYLSPVLLKKDVDPTPRTDVHALVISLLFLIFGSSPFDSVGSNVFLRREMVKQNQSINAGLNDTQNFRRLQSLQKSLGWDVRSWLEEGLGIKPLNLETWRVELERGLGR